MPVYEYHCDNCEDREDMLVKYEDRKDTVPCECGGSKTYRITGCAFIPSLGGAHRGRITPPPVGPMHKETKAYQKKMDESNSRYYLPGDTFGDGGIEGFKKREARLKEMDSGKQNFTKG